MSAVPEIEPHFNTAGTHVLVIYPDTGARWECPPDYLPTARQLGWELAEPEPDPEDQPSEPEKPARRAKKSTAPGD